ncbi:hypothetical protein JWJ90_17065 [Desulfobulbus rhabdoformis]|uniref:hypothetical protein n=1 Tax=Desulfobulbus rhabdoformis TaxID=34032 RepID=UPI0019623BEA|nr:hypothetical protein [Desulfobulbus rhabdoformis]MBM9615982.1 hypothetical protein [Desulfobulbus rhabdoformis]
MFGLFKTTKKFPVMRLDMFQPAGEQLSKWTDVKRCLISYLDQIGYCGKEDAIAHYEEIRHEFECQLDELKYEISEIKEDIRDSKKEITSFRKDLRKCSEEQEQKYIERDIQDENDAISEMLNRIESINKQITTLKADKRELVINYVNCMILGDNWRSQ